MDAQTGSLAPEPKDSNMALPSPVQQPPPSADLISLAEAAKLTPYSQEYISLLARRGKLLAWKQGRNWFTTKQATLDYLTKQVQEAEAEYEKKAIFNPAAAQSEPALAAPSPSSSVQPAVEAAREIANVLGETLSAKFDTLQQGLREVGDRVSQASAVPPTVIVQPPAPEPAHHPRKPLIFYVLILLLVLPLLFLGLSKGIANDLPGKLMLRFKNAWTLDGHRAGTNANEVLILNEAGNISIKGHIETEGQLRSYARDGVAPIIVDSTTKIENLNADSVDGFSPEQFTLAFVTKNGNVTEDDVYLKGKVEAGSTLEVKGATKLLDALLVDGTLGVWGEALFHDDVAVDGNVDLKQDLTVGNGVTVQQDVNVGGDITVKGGATVGGPLSVNGDINTQSHNLDLGSGTISTESREVVRNLNAELWNGRAAGDFDLDYVTDNGAITDNKVTVGGLDVNGPSQFFGRSIFKDNAYAEGTFTATGRAELLGETFVTNLNLQNLTVPGRTNLGRTNIDGTLDINAQAFADNLSVSGALAAAGSLGVGGETTLGSDSRDKLTVEANSLFKAAITANQSFTLTSTSPVINTTAGALTLQSLADDESGNIQIGSGTGSTTPDLLVVDVKSDVGDPAGTEGAIYYNDNLGKFRCYENGAWTDCVTTGGVSTLQGAYDGGNTINTTTGRDISFTLADSLVDGNLVVNVADGSTSTVAISRLNGAGTADPAQLLLLDNLDLNRSIADGLRIQSAAGLISDAIDASDPELVNALNVGDNSIVGTTPLIDFTNFDVDASGNITSAGDVAVNGGNLTTTNATGNVFNTNASTVNLGGAAGTVNLGPGGATATSVNLAGGSGATGCTADGATGDFACAGNITATGDVAVNGGDLTSTSGAFNLVNTGVPTINFAGAATTLNINDSTAESTIDIGGVDFAGSNTIRIATDSTFMDVIAVGNVAAGTTVDITSGLSWSITGAGLFTTSNDIAVNGGDITTTATTFNLLAGATTALNIGAGAATATSINLAGGSGATGCTMAGDTGNFTCSGNITGAATGTVGYWNRTGTTLSPATANDLVTIASNTVTASPLTITASALGTDGSGTGAAVIINATTSTSGAGENAYGQKITLAGASGDDGYNLIGQYIQTTGGDSTNTAYGSYITLDSDTPTNIGLYVTAAGPNTNYAAIFDQGNVGIRNTAPEKMLQLGQSGGAESGFLRLTEIVNGNDADIYITNDDSDLRIDAPNNVFIMPSGNVGIGDLSPTQDLTVTGDASVSTYLRVGSETAPTNTTAGDLTSTRLSVGNSALGASGQLAIVSGTLTDTAAGSVSAVAVTPTLSPGSASSSGFLGLRSDVTLSGANNFASSYSLTGYGRFSASGNATIVGGTYSSGFYGSTSTNFGTVTDAYGGVFTGVDHFTNNPSGTITNATSVLANNQVRGGANLAITNSRGVVINNQTLGGTSNVNLLVGTTTSPSGNYSVYNSSAYQNYFAGNVGIGNDTTPDTNLHISKSTGGALSEILRLSDTSVGVNLRVQLNPVVQRGVQFGVDVDGGGFPATDILTLTETRVGIGSTTPGYNLEVASANDAAIYLNSDTDNVTEDDNSFIKFSQDGALVQAILGTVGNVNVDPENVAYSGVLNNGTLLGTLDSLGALQFGTNDAVRMTIDVTGNVGINDATPDAWLDVEPTGAVTTTVRGTGLHVNNLTTNATTDGLSKYGLLVNSSGAFAGGAGTQTTNYGIYVGSTSGGDRNYGIELAGSTASSTIGAFSDDGDISVGGWSGSSKIVFGDGENDYFAGYHTFKDAAGVSKIYMEMGNGRIGVGDANPNAFIDSTGTTEQLRLSYETANTNFTSFTVSSTGDLTIDGTGSGAVEQLVLANGDIINIGGSGSTDVAYNVIGDSTASASASMNSDDDLYIEGDLEVDGSLIAPATGTSGYWSRSGTTLSPATITDSVGIGTASAAYRAHIVNSGAGVTDIAGIYNNLAQAVGTGARLVFEANSADEGGPGDIRRQVAGVAGILETNTAFDSFTGDLAFYARPAGDPVSTSITEYMRILGSGRVGIGDTTPDYKLEVGAAAASDSSFALSDADVGHGMTNVAQSDAWFEIEPISSTVGGGRITALTDADGQPLLIQGIGSSGITDTTAAVKIVGAISSVPNQADMNAADTVFQVANNDNAAALTLLGNNNFGIGDTTPDSPLELLSTTTPQFRISYTDTTQDTTFAVSSTGDLTIDGTGTGVTEQVILADADIINIGGSGSTDVAYNVIGDSTAGASATMNSDDDLYIEGNLEVDGGIATSTFSGALASAGTEPDNMVRNGNFEYANVSTTISDNWSIDFEVAGSGQSYSRDCATTANIREGACSQAITTSGAANGTSIATDTIPVQPGQTYAASVQVLGNFADGFYFRALYYAATGNTARTDTNDSTDMYADVATTASWATYQGTFTVPSASQCGPSNNLPCTRLKIALYHWNPVAGAVTRYYDGLVLRRTFSNALLGLDASTSTSTSNVGIGTTAITSGKLNVTSASGQTRIANFYSQSTDDANFEIGSPGAAAKSILGFSQQGTATRGGLMWDQSTSVLSLFTGDFTTQTNRISIDSAGEVGIGTDTPAADLDVVAGGLKVGPAMTSYAEATGRISVTGSSGEVEFQDRATGAGTWSTTDRGVIYYDTDLFRFHVNAVDRMNIDSNGDVGIGLAGGTAAAARLEIDAASNTTGIRLKGLAETTEISDFFVGAGGELVISNTAGADANQFIDLRPEDDQWGLVVRQGNGVATTAYLNVYAVDTTNDYVNMRVSNATSSSLGFFIDDDDQVGVGISDPTGLLHLSGYTPASVGTSPGTAADNVLTALGGTGGATTIATTGVGGIGGAYSLTGGTGGVANSAATSSTGGVGGAFTVVGGTGGAATAAGTTRVGGAGGALNLAGGVGGAASGGTDTGGAGGNIELAGGTGGSGDTGGVGGDVYIVGGAAGSGGSPAVGDVLLAITSGATARGKVGIGTNSPASQLDVEGGVTIGATYSGTNAAPTNGLRVEGQVTIGKTGEQAYSTIQATATSDPAIILEDQSDFVSYFAADGGGADEATILGSEGAFKFKTGVTFASGPISSGTVQMYIDGTSGNVGIGTSTVTAGKLVVAQTDAANLEGIYIDTEESTTTQNVFAIQTDTATGSGADTLKFKITADGSTYNDANVYSTPADVAEMYYVLGIAEAGDVVELAEVPSGTVYTDTFAAQRTSTPQSPRLLGVVSTKPGPVINYDWKNPEKLASQRPIALAGRVPVKVSAENGPIALGDHLTSSSTTGVAMRATAAGPTIGIALQPYSGSGVGAIEVFVSRGYFVPGTDSYLSTSGGELTGMLKVAASGTPLRLDLVGTPSVEAPQTLFSAQFNGEDRFRLLENGDASLSGTLAAASITLGGPARISGTLLQGEVGEAYVGTLIQFTRAGKTLFALDGNGLMQVDTVKTRALVIDNADAPRATIGSGIVPAGSTSVTLAASEVRPGMKIFLTPKLPLSQSLAVTNVQSGSFTVSLAFGSASDVPFDWWLVDVTNPSLMASATESSQPAPQPVAEPAPAPVSEPVADVPPATEPVVSPEPTPEPAPQVAGDATTTEPAPVADADTVSVSTTP